MLLTRIALESCFKRVHQFIYPSKNSRATPDGAYRIPGISSHDYHFPRRRHAIVISHANDLGVYSRHQFSSQTRKKTIGALAFQDRPRARALRILSKAPKPEDAWGEKKNVTAYQEFHKSPERDHHRSA